MKTITSIDYGENVNLILFHNWIIRRAGKYRSGSWPANEIQAQLNYLLAAREVCFDMGLAEAPDPGFVGSVGLYGFETNFPHGHVDYPPHFHIVHPKNSIQHEKDKYSDPSSRRKAIENDLVLNRHSSTD